MNDMPAPVAARAQDMSPISLARPGGFSKLHARRPPRSDRVERAIDTPTRPAVSGSDDTSRHTTPGVLIEMLIETVHGDEETYIVLILTKTLVQNKA
jgi:hypothetical protein